MKKKNIEDILWLLNIINWVPSVVWYEQYFLRWLYTFCKPYSVDISLLRWYVCVKVWESESVYSAHADRHGMIKTGIDEYHYAATHLQAFQKNVSYEKQINGLLVACTRMINQPVVAYNPFSGEILWEDIVKEAHMCDNDTKINFELPWFSELPLWTPIGYAHQFEIADWFVSSQLDNTISIAILLHMIKNWHPWTYLFTVEEEIWNSWYWIQHYVMMQKNVWKKMYVLDSSPYPHGVEQSDKPHVILRHRDSYTTFDQELTKDLASRADSLGIPYMFKDQFVDEYNREWWHDLWYGSTELWAFLTRSPFQIPATTIQIPTTGYHTAHETTLVENIDLLWWLIKDID